jgi:hypothetical protein
MSVTGPLPLPTVTGVWEGRRGVGWRIGGNTNINISVAMPVVPALKNIILYIEVSILYTVVASEPR